jgi:Cys-rich four helix bundle protein (predicted Tat secretion target)
MLTNAAAALAAVAAGSAFAAEHDHKDMDMGGMDMSHMHHHQQSSRNERLIAAASDCVLKAGVCHQHCVEALGKGDKDMIACAQSSSEVLAICNALQQMATAESKYLPQLAKVAMDICKNCEDECKKTNKHPECKDCEDACAACYKECKAIAA